jgi:hypothetical protein
MKEISSMNFPQHGEVFYFYGQALPTPPSRIRVGKRRCNYNAHHKTYIHTYHSSSIPKGLTEASQIFLFLRDELFLKIKKMGVLDLTCLCYSCIRQKCINECTYVYLEYLTIHLLHYKVVSGGRDDRIGMIIRTHNQ